MKTGAILITLILIVSCSSKQLTLEQFAKLPIKFSMQKINGPNNDFTLDIPKNWIWKVGLYDDKNIILGIEAVSPSDKEGFVDLISVHKLKSTGGNKNLKSEFEYVLNVTKNHAKELKLVEFGETNILIQKAFFIHTKSAAGTYGELEMINFILASKNKGIFYFLTVSASQTDRIKKNMSILIHSLETFQIN